MNSTDTQETVYTGAMENISHNDIIFDPSGDIFRKNNEESSSTRWLFLKYLGDKHQWVHYDSLYSVKPTIGSDIKHIHSLSYTGESIKLENGQEAKYLIIYQAFCQRNPDNPGDLHLKTKTFGIQGSSEWISVEGSRVVDKYSTSRDFREIPIYQSDICTNPLHYDPYEIITPDGDTAKMISPWSTEEIVDSLIVDKDWLATRNSDEENDNIDNIEEKSDYSVRTNESDKASSKTDLQEVFEEYRVDPHDNKWYTESEFKEYYSGVAEWDFQEPKKLLMREEIKNLAWGFRNLEHMNFKSLLKTYRETF